MHEPSPVGSVEFAALDGRAPRNELQLQRQQRALRLRLLLQTPAADELETRIEAIGLQETSPRRALEETQPQLLQQQSSRGSLVSSPTSRSSVSLSRSLQLSPAAAELDRATSLPRSPPSLARLHSVNPLRTAAEGTRVAIRPRLKEFLWKTAKRLEFREHLQGVLPVPGPSPGHSHRTVVQWSDMPLTVILLGSSPSAESQDTAQPLPTATSGFASDIVDGIGCSASGPIEGPSGEADDSDPPLPAAYRASSTETEADTSPPTVGFQPESALNVIVESLREGSSEIEPPPPPPLPSLYPAESDSDPLHYSTSAIIPSFQTAERLGPSVASSVSVSSVSGSEYPLLPDDQSPPLAQTPRTGPSSHSSDDTDTAHRNETLEGVGKATTPIHARSDTVRAINAAPRALPSHRRLRSVTAALPPIRINSVDFRLPGEFNNATASSQDDTSAQPTAAPSSLERMQSHTSHLMPTDVLPYFVWIRRRFLSPSGSFLCLPDHVRRNLLLFMYPLISLLILITMCYPDIGEYTAFTAVLAVILFPFLLPSLDVTLFGVIARKFNTWYLLFNVTVLICCLAVAGNTSGYVIAQTCVFFLFQTLLTTLLDATDVRTATRIGCCLFLMMGSAIILIQDVFFTPLVSARTIWLGYFMDTQRAADISAMSCLLYAARYCYNAVRNHMMHVQGLCTVSLPVECKLVKLSQRDIHQYDLAYRGSITSNSRESSSISGTANQTAAAGGPPTELVRLRSERMSAYFNHSGSDVLSASRAETAHSPTKHDGIVEAFYSFQPINSNPWCRKRANHRYYKVFFVLVTLDVLAIASFPGNLPDWVYFVCILPTPAVIAFELTRYDRTLMLTLTRCFEFWFINLSVVQFALFWTFWKESTTVPVATLNIVYFAAAFLVQSQDAGPAYPFGLRCFLIGCLMANSVRVLVLDSLNPYGYSDFSSADVCLYFCARARVLALSGLFTQFIFLTKYIVMLFRFRRRCIILETGLEYHSLPKPTLQVHRLSSIAVIRGASHVEKAASSQAE